MSILKSKTAKYLLIGALITVFVVEILLRVIWGFGNMVLFFDDPGFEYLATPNQDKTRFGNHIFYNEYSMRSKPLAKSDSCIVLGFGDSVINGGTLTDQDSIATSIVEKLLGGNARFLNISAGSWGPDNCAAYLKKYGDFGAKMIVLFVSSHDAHDNMTFEKTVGVHEAYPDHQYPLAIIEVVDKYVYPRLMAAIGTRGQQNELMINKNGDGFNTGFKFFLDHTRERGIPLVVCLHAEKLEVEHKAYNEQGKEIIKFCLDNNIKMLNGLEVGEQPGDFRDEIHLTESGQRRWVRPLQMEIENNLGPCIRH
jgi:hypothetical protein